MQIEELSMMYLIRLRKRGRYMEANGDVSYNRNHKDTLFRKLFGEDKENALSLYNAVNGTDYTNADDLEFTTLDDVIYMKMKNDTSFLFDRFLNLYEHQSTYNPNMPLRGFLYFGDLYRQLLPKSERLYGTKLVEIPAPKYIVFYNGAERLEGGRKVLHLSDAFRPKGVSEGFEWTATMIDINYGSNAVLMEKCKVLSEYSQFIAKVRELNESMSLEDAIDAAVEYCIQNKILHEFLEKHRREVKDMTLTEFNEERYAEVLKEEGRAEEIIVWGKEMGLARTEILERLMKRLDISMEEAEQYYD